jgi:opacity protein-like surface antigen
MLADMRSFALAALLAACLIGAASAQDVCTTHVGGWQELVRSGDSMGGITLGANIDERKNVVNTFGVRASHTVAHTDCRAASDQRCARGHS